MTYACWELAKDQVLQERLRKEVLTLSGGHTDQDDILGGKELEALPFFNGFLKEILRGAPPTY